MGLGRRQWASLEFVAACLDADDAQRVDSIADDRGQRALIFLRPLGAPQQNSLAIDNLTLCYMLEEALRRDRRSALLEMCKDRKAFFKWEEVFSTLNHAQNTCNTLAERAVRLPTDAGLDDVSAFVAGEQVRLVCLARIYHALTGIEL
jgi:hypothetical protein